MKHWLYLALAIGSVGCRTEVAASVLCEIKEGPVVQCVVTQTKGTAKMDVCWEYKATCANKATLEAPHSCGRVEDGGKNTVTIHTESLKITGSCEGEVTGAVTGLTINGEATK